MTNKWFPVSGRNWSSLEWVEMVEGGAAAPVTFNASGASVPALYSWRCGLLGTMGLLTPRTRPDPAAAHWQLLLHDIQVPRCLGSQMAGGSLGSLGGECGLGVRAQAVGFSGKGEGLGVTAGCWVLGCLFLGGVRAGTGESYLGAQMPGFSGGGGCGLAVGCLDAWVLLWVRVVVVKAPDNWVFYGFWEPGHPGSVALPLYSLFPSPATGVQCDRAALLLCQ